MSALCQLEFRLSESLKGSSGDNSADERSPADAAQALADLFDEDCGSNTRLRSRAA
jgi:hypothetical protein